MMKHTTLLITLLSVFAFNGFGQYAKVYFADQKIETEEVKIDISNVIALPAEVKFKLEMENLTSDFLLFDASKCNFTVNGNTYSPKDKFFIIEPYAKKSKTMGIVAEGLGEVRQFAFEFNGLQRVVLTDEQFTVEGFTLPASKNSFVTGPFTVNLKNYKKETSATLSKYEVQYKGKDIGFVMPANISVTMPDGKDYANADKKPDPVLLFPGDTDKFMANWDRMPGGRVNDMQLVEMKLNFEGVFREGKTQDLEAQHATFEWDEALTIEKNK